MLTNDGRIASSQWKLVAWTIILALAPMLAWALSPFGGQQTVSRDQNNTVVFYSIGELTKPRGGQVTLRGGTLADPKDWPASFYSLGREGPCTSTLVGPRALLTAAHCVPDERNVVIRIKNITYNGLCNHSDLYDQPTPDKTADWAMCLMDKPVGVSQYETINADGARIRVQTKLLLTGFGCTTASGGGDDGHYRTGEAPVTAIPANGENDIVTEGEVALCFGDSGGGAFLYLDSGKKRRIQVSVNSRVEKDDYGRLLQISRLSSLSTPAAQMFLKEWVSKNAVDVCGVNSTGSMCRN